MKPSLDLRTVQSFRLPPRYFDWADYKHGLVITGLQPPSELVAFDDAELSHNRDGNGRSQPLASGLSGGESCRLQKYPTAETGSVLFIYLSLCSNRYLSSGPKRDAILIPQSPHRLQISTFPSAATRHVGRKFVVDFCRAERRKPEWLLAIRPDFILYVNGAEGRITSQPWGSTRR